MSQICNRQKPKNQICQFPKKMLALDFHTHTISLNNILQLSKPTSATRIKYEKHRITEFAGKKNITMFNSLQKITNVIKTKTLMCVHLPITNNSQTEKRINSLLLSDFLKRIAAASPPLKAQVLLLLLLSWLWWWSSGWLGAGGW